MSDLIVLVKELGCGYRWDEEVKELRWCPIQYNKLDMDEEEWCFVDEANVGSEIVTYNGKEATLSEVYRDVERKLGVKK